VGSVSDGESVMSAIREKTWTVEKYLAFERESEQKHEFPDGEVYAMGGAGRNHNLIALHVGGSLDIQLSQRTCEAYANDMRVRIAPTIYFYPDVVVTYDTPQFEDSRPQTLLNPTVIIEVLSSSTEKFDRGKKSTYRTLESLQEYLLISQDGPHVEHYKRQEDGSWSLADVTAMDSKVELHSIECTLAMADIYRKVNFEADED
jgi:Uma2 family endonuclease